MHRLFQCISLALICLTKCAFGFFDPVSIGLSVGAGLGLYNFKTIKDNTYCRFAECCNDDSIPVDIGRLDRDLRDNVFGQHIVQQQVVAALKAHFSDNRNRKPLVLSFHGTPGTGKNFVSDSIAKSLYKKGLESTFVHKYLGRADFPLAELADYYSAQVVTQVRSAIESCPRSLFIFDEVDKMPPKVFEALTALVNYNAGDSEAVFLFLSNTAGVHIADKLGEIMKGGKLREGTKLSDFERILEKGAYNLEGGLQKTSLIESHVIDHFIPFLPLEKSHVLKCVKTEFKRWGRVPSDEVAEGIVKDVVTYDRTHGIFSISGCKKIDKKVAVAAHMKF